MPAYTLQPDHEFKNPYRGDQPWTTAYRVIGPRVDGHVWITPHVPGHDALLRPTGMTINYGGPRSVSGTPAAGLVVNGAQMVGQVRIDRPNASDEVTRSAESATASGSIESASRAAQAVVHEILQLVVGAYLADPDTIQAHRRAYRQDLAQRRLELAEKRIERQEEELTRVAAALERDREEARRLREIIH
jgi:hypothetical protein